MIDIINHSMLRVSARWVNVKWKGWLTVLLKWNWWNVNLIGFLSRQPEQCWQDDLQKDVISKNTWTWRQDKIGFKLPTFRAPSVNDRLCHAPQSSLCNETLCIVLKNEKIWALKKVNDISYSVCIFFHVLYLLITTNCLRLQVCHIRIYIIFHLMVRQGTRMDKCTYAHKSVSPWRTCSAAQWVSGKYFWKLLVCTQPTIVLLFLFIACIQSFIVHITWNLHIFISSLLAYMPVCQPSYQSN